MRALCFIVRYPEFSETYIHEEIRSLRKDHEVQIITYRLSKVPRKQPFPYKFVPYLDTCPVYGSYQKIDREFTNLSQRWFLHQVGKVIEEFRPDVMHGHYFGMALIMGQLAERHGVPYTLRTHSMDVLAEPRSKLEGLCTALRSQWCLRALVFPAFRETLLELGAPEAKVVSCWPVLNYERFHDRKERPRTGGVLCSGPAIPKKRHQDFIDLAARMRGQGFTFDLYARGPTVKLCRARNRAQGNPATITYVDPDEMGDVYKRYDWLVYPADETIQKVGLPVSIVEAQAAGVGVCWQELPGRREEQLEYLGGAGFLYRSIDEVPEILANGYPDEYRARGYENARKCDIEGHKHLLTDAWRDANSPASPAGFEIPYGS